MQCFEHGGQTRRSSIQLNGLADSRYGSQLAGDRSAKGLLH